MDEAEREEDAIENSMAIHATSTGQFAWTCRECSYYEGPWDYWETAEMSVLGHRRKRHGGNGHIAGYDLRPGRDG